jgi:hypothetical protein
MTLKNNKYLHMKKTILLLILIATNSLLAQESKEQKIDLSFSYGLSYSDYSSTDPLNLELPSIGSFYEINFDYKLPKNRYIGLGYSRQQHSKNINNGVLITSTNTALILDNYRNTLTKDFFDVHFRTVFNNNIQFTLGAFYFIEHHNTNSINGDGTNFYFILNSEKNRSDNLGLFGSLEYYFKLTDYADLGLKGKLYYSLNGIESLAFLPTLRVKL